MVRRWVRNSNVFRRVYVGAAQLYKVRFDEEQQTETFN